MKKIQNLLYICFFLALNFSLGAQNTDPRDSTSVVHGLRELTTNEALVQTNNTGVESDALAALKQAANELRASAPSNIASNFKVYDYATYPALSQMGKDADSEAMMKAMEAKIVAANISSAPFYYCLIGKYVSSTTGKTSFTIKLKLPVAGTNPQPGLWNNLTPQKIEGIEKDALKAADPNVLIIGIDETTTKVINDLKQRFQNIVRGWTGTITRFIKVSDLRAGEKYGLSPDGRIIEYSPIVVDREVYGILARDGDVVAYAIIGFGVYKTDNSLEKEYQWQGDKYVNPKDVTDVLNVVLSVNDGQRVWLSTSENSCSFKYAGIDWSAAHRAACGGNIFSYINSNFTNIKWESARMFNGNCSDPMKKNNGATVGEVVSSSLSSTDYSNFRTALEDYIVKNTPADNDLVTDKTGGKLGISTQQKYMIVYAKDFNNVYFDDAIKNSPHQAIIDKFNNFTIGSGELLILLVYDGDASVVGTNKIKIGGVRMSENRVRSALSGKNETKWIDCEGLYKLPFQAIIEISDFMSRGLEHLKFSDKWWKDCKVGSEWYMQVLEYAGIGAVLKPVMDTPDFKSLTGYDPKVTSTFKVQVAFTCGAWNGVVDIVKSVPELVKLLSGLVTNETQDKIGKGYTSLKDTEIVEEDGTISCKKGDFFCKLWPTITHGMVAMLAQLNTPCAKANFAGQIIGPLATLLLPVPKVPPGGAQSLKAIETVINVLKWCDDAGDVFNYLGKSLKFIKKAGGKLNIEIKFGSKYKLEVVDGKHTLDVDGTPVINPKDGTLNFDNADDAFKAVKKTIDAFLSNLKGFNKLAAPYQMAYQNAFATMSTKSKTILSELSEAVNKNITNASDFKVGFFDDFVKLIDPKIVDRADLDKCISRFGCFAAGTSVRTSAGWFPIETLHEGDKLLAYNHNTKHVEEQIIEKTTRHTVDILQKVTLSNDEVILTTPNHLFYLRDKYVPAVELQANDTLFSNDKTALVFIKSTEVLDSTLEVYNFTVANCLNYFVGRSSVLVHNDHGTGVLGKMSAALRIQVNSLDALQDGLSARMLDYIEQFGGDKILTDLLNTQKFDELTDRLKRTAQSINIRQLRNLDKPKVNQELHFDAYENINSTKKPDNSTTKGQNSQGTNGLTAHHMPSQAFMKKYLGKDLDGKEIYNGDKALSMLTDAQSGGVGRHNRTLTYKEPLDRIPQYRDLTPAQALKHDIDELRNLYIEDGVYNAAVEKALQSYTKEMQNKFPNIVWTN